MHIVQKLIAVTTLTAVTLLPVVASARTYTKVEVLEIYGAELSTGYELNNHNCDYDFVTSDLVIDIKSAFTDGTIDNAYIRYLGHKYKNLTGDIHSKNKKYYQILLQSADDTLTSEYGQLTFTLNIKKKNPYATSHGKAKVKRSASDDYEACSSKATF
ncbi:MAG: hypothetical protein HY565_01915 [Candidatus Kerfeldbacteria bacterium]|nr:hypothetical protein [Candidatus Kerfeldbacteria bacterium]